MSQPLAPSGLREGIEQLEELVIAVADTFSAVGKARADGKITLLEMAGFVTLVPTVVKGIVGIGSVMRELRDLSSEERDYLAGLCIQREVVPATDAGKLKLDAVLAIVDAILNALHLFANLETPPKALPAEQ